MGYGSTIFGTLGGLGGGAIGGPAGGLAGSTLGTGIGSLFDSNSFSPTRPVSRFTPQQQGLQQAAISRAMSMLNQPFDFAPVEQQARRDFATKTIPGIAERFTSMGGPGAQRSSSFAGVLKGAGNDLDTNLAAMRSNYGLQQQQLLHGLIGQGFEPQFDVQQGMQQPSPLMNLLSPLLMQASQGLGEGIRNKFSQFGKGPSQTGSNATNASPLPQAVQALIEWIKSQGGQ